MKKLDDTIRRGGRPYATRLLTDLAANAQWLHQRRGNHLTLLWRTNGNDELEHVHHRPFVSASGFAALALIPWFIAPGLSQITVRLLARISNGSWDREGSPTDSQVDMRVQLVGNELQSTETFNHTFGEWRWLEMTYDVGRWPGPAPEYAMLAVEFKSRLVGNPWLAPFNYTGSASSAFLKDPFRPYAVKTSTDLYGLGPSATAPNPEDNEITATVLEHADDGLLQIVDHVLQTAPDAMIVWPPSQALGTDPGAGYGFYKAWKWWASYLQVRAVELEEVYA